MTRRLTVKANEEEVLRRALHNHRELMRSACRHKYGTHEHRALKRERLAAIEALMARFFPEEAA